MRRAPRRSYPRTYNSRRPLKIVLTVLISLIAAAVILTVTLFFSLRKYIVYDPDGTLHLEIPWLEEDMPPD
jgi:hypothetical protein